MSTVGKNEANPMSLFYTGDTELCLTQHCHQQSGLRGSPPRSCPKQGFSCHWLWEGTHPGATRATLGWGWRADNHLELTLQTPAERLCGLSSASPLTTLPDCAVHPQKSLVPTLPLRALPLTFPQLATIWGRRGLRNYPSRGPKRPQRSSNTH